MKNMDTARLCAQKCIGENQRAVVLKKELNEPFPLHWHDFFEIEIVLKGSGRQVLNGNTYDMQQGTVYLLTPTDFHEIVAAEEILLINIMFHESMLSKDCLESIMGITAPAICRLTQVEYQKMQCLGELMLLEQNLNTLYAKNLLNCMVMRILENLPVQNPVKTTQTSVLLVHKACLYMRIHFRENPSLTEIADYVQLNPSYFCKIFHKEMQKTPRQYLADLKLAYAKKILLSTDAPITEICFACGYTSLSNFLKAFKEKFQASPTEIRARH